MLESTKSWTIDFRLLKKQFNCIRLLKMSQHYFTSAFCKMVLLKLFSLFVFLFFLLSRQSFQAQFAGLLPPSPHRTPRGQQHQDNVQVASQPHLHFIGHSYWSQTIVIYVYLFIFTKFFFHCFVWGHLPAPHGFGCHHCLCIWIIFTLVLWPGKKKAGQIKSTFCFYVFLSSLCWNAWFFIGTGFMPLDTNPFQHLCVLISFMSCWCLFSGFGFGPPASLPVCVCVCYILRLCTGTHVFSFFALSSALSAVLSFLITSSETLKTPVTPQNR